MAITTWQTIAVTVIANAPVTTPARVVGGGTGGGSAPTTGQIFPRLA